MAAAVVIAESVGMALATTSAYAWLGTGLGLVGDTVTRTQVLYLALLPLSVIMLLRLAAASHRTDGAVGREPRPINRTGM